MLKKEFEFLLEDRLVYSHDGKAGIVAKKLLLRAPTTKLISLASKLNASVSAAFLKANESRKKEDDAKKDSKPSKESTEVDGAGIYMVVSGSMDEKQVDSFICLLKELILADNICLIDGKEQLTLDLLDSLDTRETLRLMGDYIANFLLPSIMDQSKKTK